MKRKGMLRILVFFLLAGVLLSQLNHVLAFRYEDGIQQMEGFYKQPRGSVDVLVMGSSHAYVDIDPAVLEAEDGIYAYDLCASMQPIWNTYYALKEALKYQDPKLIVLDIYRLVEPFDYVKESKLIKSTFGMRPSKEKMEAIRESLSVERQKDVWLYFLEFPIYHNRYRELKFTDFFADHSIPEDYRGHVPADHVEVMERPDFSQITEQMPMTEKTTLYFQKFLDLAKKEEIPVLLILTPYIVQEDDQKVYNTVTELLASYPADQVMFINFNEAYDEIGIDFENDFADYDHLNVDGCQKFSSYFGKVLRTCYELPDHRNADIKEK